MRRTTQLTAAGLAIGAAVTGTATASSGSTEQPTQVRQQLTASSPALAACMPKAEVNIKVDLRTAATGRDIFNVAASGLPANTDFTVFLLETAKAPFGAAEYIGDITTDNHGRAHNTFKLIVQEAFSSTLVNGTRVRVDLNQVGMWFADPKGDDFCLGANSPVTPFDGDNEAGVQAFNSADTTPLPAP